MADNLKEVAWEQQEKAVTLTNHQWNRLVCYITMSTKFREGEMEAWQKLAEEKHPDGQLVFPNAPEQAAYWQGMIKDLEDIKAAIDAI